MLAGMILIATIVGFASAVAMAIAGAPLAAIFAGYVASGLVATLAMAVVLAIRAPRRRRERKARPERMRSA